MLEFITTGRGGRKVLLDGYCYVVDRKRGDVTYWRCEERGSCGGRLKTKDDVVQGTPSQHAHCCRMDRIGRRQSVLYVAKETVCKAYILP